jgi:hypothetical protein
VGNGVCRINEGWNAGIENEGCGSVFFATLTFVQNHLDMNTSLMGINKGFGYRGRCKRICLNEDVCLGFPKRLHNSFSATTLGTEPDFNPTWDYLG